MRPWLHTGYRSVETHVLTSLHVSSGIHVFLLDSHALYFWIARRRVVKILSSLSMVVRVLRGSRVQQTRYFVCSLILVLKRYPKIK